MLVVVGGGARVEGERFFFFSYPAVKLMCEKRPISPPLSVFLLFLNPLVHFCINVSALCLSVYFFVLLLAIIMRKIAGGEKAMNE